MTQETIDGNKLIHFSDFASEGVKKMLAFKAKIDSNPKTWENDYLELKYHKDWNRLMPVVYEINELCSKNGQELSSRSREQEHLENKRNNPLCWKSWRFHRITLGTDINSVWGQVIKFLQWYNNQPK